MSLFIKKINNLINYSGSVLIDKLIKLQKNKINPRTLLIVKLDAIGDYVLFRNFLQVIRESEKFSDYKITLCGNIIWKELSEFLDSKFVDEFIWLDKTKFYNDISFRYRFLSNIHSSGFEISIDPTYSREILFGDTIIKAAGSPERAGSEGALEKHAKWKRTLFTDKVYTTRISARRENLFEFSRNKEFFENYLKTKISLTKPYIDTSSIKIEKFTNNRYIVFFPGAGDSLRRWSPENFIKTIKYILENYSYDIAISGSAKDSETSDKIILGVNSSRVHNLIGHSPLTHLAKLLSGADLLISNETSAVHFAAAVNTPVICISNGSYLGRFHPYPEEVFSKAFYIYPQAVSDFADGKIKAENNERFRYLSGIDVNKVKADDVIKKIKEILN